MGEKLLQQKQLQEYVEVSLMDRGRLVALRTHAAFIENCCLHKNEWTRKDYITTFLTERTLVSSTTKTIASDFINFLF
jgi:hypothetical protein